MKIQLNARNRTHYFDAAVAEKVLHAGLTRGITLPYECASGTCGTCKAKLLSGEIVDAWPDAPGRKYLKGPDEFLMCQCAAVTDISAEVSGFVQDVDPGVYVPTAIKGRIRESALLTHDVMHLSIDLQSPMDFDAGQFVLVEVGGVSGSRGWSMVNFDRTASTLRFVVKRKPGGGLSDWLFTQLHAGTDVTVYGPLGSATFAPSLGCNILCVAGGSGIAGMMSILSRAAEANYFADHDGDIFFGVRTMKDAFFLDEFSRLRERCGERLKVTIALSDEDGPASAPTDHPLLRFDTGFVHDVAGRSMQGRLQGIRAYLAGPPPSVDASIRMLLMSRVSTANIRYDKFG